MIDLTGKTFGRLSVLRKAGHSGGKAIWECLCECGTIKPVRGVHLRSGRQVSCGCLKAARATEQKTTHGHSAGGKVSPTYSVWQNMHYRCKPQNASKYPHYAHVSVCGRWSSFEFFLEDMGERPNGLTLDRIDGSMGYSPDNCRWVDMATQNRNRKDNVWVDVDGQVMCRADAQRHLKIGSKRMDQYVARNRLNNDQLQEQTA